VVDEVEQVVVGPVQVLEDQHRRPLVGQSLEELPPSGEVLGATPSGIRVGAGADERSQALEDPVVVLQPEPRYRLGQLLPGLVRRIALEDPGLCLGHLGEGPVADALAVGQRATLSPVGEVRLRVDHLPELVYESALADPGHAHERDELRRTLLARAGQSAGQQVQLAAAAHERGPGLPEVDAEAGARLLRLPDGDRIGLAFGGHRLRLPEANHLSRRALGRLVHEQAVHGSRALQARRGIDHVPRDHALTLGRSRVEGDQRLAGRNCDAHLQLAVLHDRVPNRQAGANRTLGVVFVRHRSSEDRHHRVADELLNRATSPLELAAQTRVVRRKGRAHVFRVELLRARSEANEVGEEHRDDLALLASLRRRRLEPRAAGEAEARVGGILPAALRADDHR